MNFDFLQRTFLGNTLQNYCWCLAILLGGLLLRHVLSRTIVRLLFRFFKKQSQQVGLTEFLFLLKKPIGLFISLTSIYFAFNLLYFPKEWALAPRHLFGIRQIIYKLFQTAIIFSFTWIVLRIIDYVAMILYERAQQTISKWDDQIVPFIKEGIKICIVIIAIFFMMGTVYSLNIASLIAGLGIGGLAIALAAKESIENLLASFTIFFDKPFTVGDLIDVAGIRGNVERIGFRSTRIRTVEKSFVTVANRKLIEGVLDNLTLKTLQRVRFKIALSNQTSSIAVQNIIDELTKVLEKTEKINDDFKVKFYEINPKGGIEILVLFFVNSSDWDIYLEVKQNVNFSILEIVKAAEAQMINVVQPV